MVILFDKLNCSLNDRTVISRTNLGRPYKYIFNSLVGKFYLWLFLLWNSEVEHMNSAYIVSYEHGNGRHTRTHTSPPHTQTVNMEQRNLWYLINNNPPTMTSDIT